MDSMEKTAIHLNHGHSEKNTGDINYSYEEYEVYRPTLQAKQEVEEIVHESAYESIEAQSYLQEDELSAVDLRTTRPPSSTMNPSEIFCNFENYKNKNDALSTVCLFKNVDSNNLDLVNVSFDSQVVTPTESANYTYSNLESLKGDFNKVSHNQYTSFQKFNSQKKYNLKKKFSFNGPAVCNAENNVDFVLLVDQETQTQGHESKEASVQTDIDTDKCTSSLLKKDKLSNFNCSCLVCQRYHSSKSSYDRHAQTHVQNGNVVTNIHITEKAKFMIFGENICKSQKHIGPPPMALQNQKLTKYQCSICHKLFSNQVARDVHRDNLVQDKFPMTKCKECHVKFFTLGALHEHVNFVHKRNAYKCNAYCCVFCNESFESSFNFQLHLDEHLSTQINV